MMRETSSLRLCASRAFSLIELLVVIGIVMVLVGLALPSLSRTFGSARTTRQTIGVQQCGLLLNAYTADYRDFFPVTDDLQPIPASFRFYRPLIAAGYIKSLDDIDPDRARFDIAQNIVMSVCLVREADEMRPGASIPCSEARTRPVRSTEVTFPALKGAVRAIKVTNGRITSHWCCVDGAPKGPVAFCDGSAGVFYWRELLPPGEWYTEIDVGEPVTSTWFGFRGKDKQR